jgi:Lipopolysaccharide-assembly
MIMGLAFLLSCGPYSFSGATISGIKSVYIPVMDNETIEFGLGEELSEIITEALVKDNTLKVVGQDAADAVLTGIVKSYKRKSTTFNKEDQVQEYRVDVSVVIKLVMVNGDLVWEEPNLSSYGIFAADTETEEEGKSEALEKLAELIVNRTVRDW